MAKAPVFDFTLGSHTLDELGIIHLIKAVEFEESIGKFDQVSIEIIDGIELAGMWDLAKHGNALQLSMGYHNEVVLPMCLAFLSNIEPNFENQTVKITFAGYLKALDVGEKERSLSGRTIREVVEEIVADYEPLVVGTIEAGDTMISSTNTQSNQTDLGFLEGLASSFGMKWKLEPTEDAGKWALSLYKLEYDKELAQNSLPIHAYPEKAYVSDTKALKLKSFRPRSNIFGVSSSVEIRSNNPDQPITVQTESEDPSSEPRVVTGSEIVATVFGEVVRVHFYENVTDEAAASIIAEQLMQMDELAFVTATQAQMQEGNPELRVGGVRHIVPHGITLFENIFEGDYMITGSKHRIDTQSGYDTWISVAMNCLSMPEPPEQAGWGSGGRPVLIRVYPNGTYEGWYYYQKGSTMLRGEPITDAQIRANSYWMGKVQRPGNLISAYRNPFQNYIDGVSTPWAAEGSGLPHLSTVTPQAPSGGNYWGEWYSHYWDVRIDWPDPEAMLATPVRNPTDVFIQGIGQIFLIDLPLIDQSYVIEEEAGYGGLSFTEQAERIARAASLMQHVEGNPY